MTLDRRAHLRALAQRVRTEEPSDELRDAVLIACGWQIRPPTMRAWRYLHPDGTLRPSPPNPLTSLDAAAAAMPEGLFPNIDRSPANDWTVVVWRRVLNTDRWDNVTETYAPTEPRARTAAALEAMAAEGDA